MKMTDNYMAAANYRAGYEEATREFQESKDLLDKLLATPEWSLIQALSKFYEAKQREAAI